MAGDSEKRTPWWNQEVKEAIRAKKDAFKAWLQDRSSSDLQSRYTEARKAATSAVKKSKEKSWEEFGRRLDSNYFSANKVFWKTIRRLRGKRSSITYSIKDSDGNILTDENHIFSQWREYFEGLLNPVKASTRDTHKVTHLGEDEVFTAAEVATAIKGIKSRKAAGEDEIKPEMLKALIGEGILWLTRVFQVAWKLCKTSRNWQTGVIIPIFNTSDGRQDEELDTRIGKASAVMRALHYSVVMKRELSKKAKLSIFKALFVPSLSYGHESWVMTEIMRSQVQASEMRF